MPTFVLWSRDNLIPRRPFSIDGPFEVGPRLFLTVAEIFNGECDAMVLVTLNDL